VSDIVASLPLVAVGAAVGSETVVVVEPVRLDDLVPNARVVGKDRGEDGSQPGGTAALIEDMRDRFGAEGVACVRIGDRGIELARTEGVEQVEEPRGRAAEMSTMERDLAEERLGRG
jgi:hypothetical protein